MSVRRLSTIRCKFADDLTSTDENSNEFEKVSLGGCNKPLLERRRRARINKSLDQLKALLIGHSPQLMSLAGGTNCCKLEKADILELAVEHLRMLHQQQKQQQSETDKPDFNRRFELMNYPEVPVDEAALTDGHASAPDITSSVTLESPSSARRYEAGFTDCLTEVELFFTTLERDDQTGYDVIERLASRLRTSTRRRLSSPYAPGRATRPVGSGLRRNVSQPSVTTSGTSDGWPSRYDFTAVKEERATCGGSIPEHFGGPTFCASTSLVEDRRVNEIVVRHQADSSSKNWTVHADNILNVRNGSQRGRSDPSRSTPLHTEAARLCNRADPFSDYQRIPNYDGADSMNDGTPEIVWRPW